MAAVGAWVATAIGATGTAAALVSAGVQMAISFAISKVTQPKGPKPAEVQTEIKASNAQRLRHLGRVKVSGAAMFWDWQRVGGRRRLFKLLAVGQGGISGIESWWLNDKQVAVNPDTGAVVTEPFNGRVSLRWRTGRDAEFGGGHYPTLRAAFSEWTPDHRLGGIGTVLGEFDAPKAEDIQEIFPGGDPEISVVARGAYCHNPFFEGEDAWSENVAAHLRDVLTHPVYGCLRGTDLDAPSWTQAIADCEDMVPTRTGTRKRYTGGGSYALASSITDIAQPILDACGGQLYLTPDGLLGLRVSKWRPPTYKITADKITHLSIRAGSGEMDRVSTLVPKYTEPDLGFQTTDADAWDDPAVLAEIGETAPRDMDLPWVQHHGQARHLAKAKLARINPRWTATVRLRWWGLLLLDQENVWLDLPHLGISNEPFWIDGWSFDSESEDGPCVVTLVHADPSSLAVVAADDGQPPAKPPEIANGYVPSPLSIDAVEVIRDDGPPFIRITASGFDATQGGIGQYRPQGRSTWTDMIRERISGAPDGTKYFRTLPLEDRTEYDLRVRATNGVFEDRMSGWAEVTGIEVYANETPPNAPELVRASGAAGGALSVTFAPDLGANYYRTGLYRSAPGGVFADAALVKWDMALSSEVTMTAPIPAGGAKYWLSSENESGVPSVTATLVGQYI